MGEEEIRQDENCQNCEQASDISLIGYDILALIFCAYPILTTIFTIDYHNPNNIVQTAGKMFLYALFPLIISMIGMKNANKAKKISDKAFTISNSVFSVVFVLLVVYFVILLVGFADGGKLF